MAMTKAQVEEKLQLVEEERDALLKAQAEFIEDIVSITAHAAIEHDLCSELEACLDVLGVTMPKVTVQVVTDYSMPLTEAYRQGLIDFYEGTWNTTPDYSLNEIKSGGEYGLIERVGSERVVTPESVPLAS